MYIGVEQKLPKWPISLKRSKFPPMGPIYPLSLTLHQYARLLLAPGISREKSFKAVLPVTLKSVFFQFEFKKINPNYFTILTKVSVESKLSEKISSFPTPQSNPWTVVVVALNFRNFLVRKKNC